MIYLGLIIGVLIFVLMDYNKSEVENFGKYLGKKDNIVTILLNIIAGVGLILAWKEDPTALSLIGIENVTFITAMIFGVTGHTLINGIVTSVNKKSRTKLGINEQG